jgi:caffeoylshikimate esterase
VIGVDFEGFGISDGLLGYIESFPKMVEDGFEAFKSTFAENAGYKRFIMGESMGGATVIRMLLSHGEEHWDGAILLAPMCKISDNVTPPAPVVKALVALAEIVPTSTIVPGPDLVPISFRNLKFVELMDQSPFRFKRNSRVKTAVELLHATTHIAANMEKFTAPLLILQGDKDVVTDPVTSREFHDRCKSADKEYKLYPGAFHCLLEEPNADETVLKDILEWIQKRL